MSLFYPRPATHRQRGFSFFEVLVAAVILGIGVMGFAGLQMRAMGSTSTAHFRAQAAVLAGEMAERIRIVHAGFMSLPVPVAPDPVPDPRRATSGTAYAGHAAWGSVLPAGAPNTWNPRAQTCILNNLAAAGCTEIDVVRNDVLEMRFLANQLLPAGAMNVQLCGADPTVLCVAVAWSGQAPAACALGDNNNRCFVLQVLL